MRAGAAYAIAQALVEIAIDAADGRGLDLGECAETLRNFASHMTDFLWSELERRPAVEHLRAAFDHLANLAAAGTRDELAREIPPVFDALGEFWRSEGSLLNKRLCTEPAGFAVVGLFCRDAPELAAQLLEDLRDLSRAAARGEDLRPAAHAVLHHTDYSGRSWPRGAEPLVELCSYIAELAEELRGLDYAVLEPHSFYPQELDFAQLVSRLIECIAASLNNRPNLSVLSALEAKDLQVRRPAPGSAQAEFVNRVPPDAEALIAPAAGALVTVNVDGPQGTAQREESIAIRDDGRVIKISRLFNAAELDFVVISGPSLTRLFRIVATSAPEYIRWEDLCSKWVNVPGWKGHVPTPESLKDYGRRINRIMRDAGFTKFWRYSSDEVAWKPPSS